MSFKLTAAHIKSIMEPFAQGDWAQIVGAIDPDVDWIIADPAMDSKTLSGTYNLQEWTEKVAGPLGSRLQGPPSMDIISLDVVGQKVIFEAKGSGMQKNGKPYNNRFCWILIFSEESGKIVTIREYLNSALVKEVMQTNEGI